MGKCCRQTPSANTIGDLRKVLRSALSHAMTEELISKNVAALVKLPPARRRRGPAWSTEEARQFLESARRDNDPLYAAYVLVLVLGLRKGEVLGLSWDGVNLEKAELTTELQIQRVKRQFLHRETKTAASEATLPIPQLCVSALRMRQDQEDVARVAAGQTWRAATLVFTNDVRHPGRAPQLQSIMGPADRALWRPQDHRARRPPDLRFAPG